jgi:hypothetical protein
MDAAVPPILLCLTIFYKQISAADGNQLVDLI